MSESWYGTDSKVWFYISLIASIGILIAGLAYMMTDDARAQPSHCTASGLSNALGSVALQTGGWLNAHPAAEAVVNSADENAIRTYFAANSGEWSELQAIATPLRNLRNSCPQQVDPGQIAQLFNAMAS